MVTAGRSRLATILVATAVVAVAAAMLSLRLQMAMGRLAKLVAMLGNTLRKLWCTVVDVIGDIK